MTGNLSSPRARWRRSDPMAAYDRLPPELRAWLAGAALPWSVSSALRLWHRALRETGCPTEALARLARAETRTLAREAAQVRGRAFPTASPRDLPPGAAPPTRRPPGLAHSQILSGGPGGEAPPAAEEEGEGPTTRRKDFARQRSI